MHSSGLIGDCRIEGLISNPFKAYYHGAGLKSQGGSKAPAKTPKTTGESAGVNLFISPEVAFKGLKMELDLPDLPITPFEYTNSTPYVTCQLRIYYMGDGDRRNVKMICFIVFRNVTLRRLIFCSA